MRAEPANPWAVVVSETRRLRVRIVPTHHGLLHMGTRNARLIRHAPHRGGGLVLLIWDGLSAEEAAMAALRILAVVSTRAWRACGRARRVGT